jgi:hypothetical protein
MAYVSDADLRRMTLQQLSHAYLTDPPNAHRYRPEINRRIAAGDPEALAIYGNGRTKPHPVPLQPTLKSPPDIRQDWYEVKQDGWPMTRLATTILNSGWDFTDPIGKMTMPPEAVEDFLRGLEWQPDQFYRELPPEMQRTLVMIIDVYGRWYRRQ